MISLLAEMISLLSPCTETKTCRTQTNLPNGLQSCRPQERMLSVLLLQGSLASVIVLKVSFLSNLSALYVDILKSSVRTPVSPNIWCCATNLITPIVNEVLKTLRSIWSSAAKWHM